MTINNIGNMMNLKIQKFIMMPTRRHTKQVNRSFTLNTNSNTIDNIINIIESNNNNKITLTDTVMHLNGVANMSFSPTYVAEIPNGWETERLIYILVVDSNIQGAIVRSYIQGYSEWYEPSYRNTIDDNLPFVVNSITEVNMYTDPITGKVIVKPIGMYNVFTDRVNNITPSIDYDPLKLVRPYDIVTNISLEDLAASNNYCITSYADTLSVKPMISKRSYNIPAMHFTKTINAFIDGVNVNSGYLSDTSSIYNDTKNILQEPGITKNMFMFAIGNIQNQFNTITFTPEVLRKIDPNVDHVATLITNSEATPMFNTNVYDPQSAQNLLNPRFETVVATKIMQDLVGICMQQLISNITISFTNRVLGMEPIVTITSASSFIDGIAENIIPYCNNVESIVKNILIPEVTNNNLYDIEVSAIVDILNEVVIMLSIGGNPMETFRFAAFADSLYSPVITTKSSQMDVISQYQTIFDRILINKMEHDVHYDNSGMLYHYM